MKRFRTINPLLWRVMVFFGLFLFISGTIGPRVISGGILFRDGFALYGGFGKALIFATIAFILLARRNKRPVTFTPWRPILLGWIAVAFGAFVVTWASIGRLLIGENQPANLVLAHVGLLLTITCAAIGCIGVKNVQLVWRRYSHEILYSAGLGVAFYIFLLVVYALWQPLAGIVLSGVMGLLNLSGLHAALVPPHTLMFDRFGITVAEYCSGIESIALFTSLYAVVGLLDWERLNKKRYFAVFPLALLALSALNILRVYGLIMAGYYINPEIAFSLFHTYAGLVFFIIYSAIFWAIAYKYLLTQPAAKREKE